jgi:hypothetical protein
VGNVAVVGVSFDSAENRQKFIASEARADLSKWMEKWAGKYPRMC